LGLDEGDDVGCDLCGWTCEASLGGFVDGASPSSLVETVYFDAAGGEGGKKFVVAVYVVVEAMYEDQFCNWRSVRLGKG
jgi:hypothetical protein